MPWPSFTRDKRICQIDVVKYRPHVSGHVTSPTPSDAPVHPLFVCVCGGGVVCVILNLVIPYK